MLDPAPFQYPRWLQWESRPRCAQRHEVSPCRTLRREVVSGGEWAEDIVVGTPEEVERYRDARCLVICPALAKERPLMKPNRWLPGSAESPSTLTRGPALIPIFSLSRPPPIREEPVRCFSTSPQPIERGGKGPNQVGLLGFAIDFLFKGRQLRGGGLHLTFQAVDLLLQFDAFWRCDLLPDRSPTVRSCFSASLSLPRRPAVPNAWAGIS